MPIIRKLPRRGFTNSEFRKHYSIINVSDLNRFEEGTVIDAGVLLEYGVLSKVEDYGVKVLGNGKLEKAVTVKAAKFSDSAKKKIQEANGSFEEV